MKTTGNAAFPVAPRIVLSMDPIQLAEIPPGLVVAWHEKFTTVPSKLPFKSHTPTVPTCGSIGPA